MRERLVEADLQTLPLLAMPMSKDDMKEARELDRKMARIVSDMRKDKGLLEKAEKRLSQVEASPSIFIGRVAEAQKAVDDLRIELDRLEQEQQEVESSVSDFRQRVLAKMDGTSED
jgi:hypothetical protein